jgi:DNA-binding MarR family transcriptional regulator
VKVNEIRSPDHPKVLLCAILKKLSLKLAQPSSVPQKTESEIGLQLLRDDSGSNRSFRDPCPDLAGKFDTLVGFRLTNQTISATLLPMLDSVRRLLDAYPAIFLACHRRHLRSDAAGKPVTERQASVLDHLDPARPTTLSRLAEHMGVGLSSMSILVARLVRAGYVAQRRDASDSRRVALTLTPAGARIKADNAVLDPQLLRKMFALMPATEMESSLRGIESLAKYARILQRQRTASSKQKERHDA